MVLSAYIVDDEYHAIDILKDYIDSTEGMYCAGFSQNPVTAIQEVNQLAPDILFLDINMPDLNGLSFIRLITTKTKVVFTTAFTQYALNAFESNAFDYLVKPISYERFIQFSNKIRLFSPLTPELPEASFFYIKCEHKGKMVKIDYEEILYVESSSNYVIICLREAKYTTYLTMIEVMNKLPSSCFLRIHKSFIINCDKVHAIEGNQLILTDKTVLQIGSTYKEQFFKYIDSLMLKTGRW